MMKTLRRVIGTIIRESYSTFNEDEMMDVHCLLIDAGYMRIMIVKDHKYSNCGRICTMTYFNDRMKIMAGMQFGSYSFRTHRVSIKSADLLNVLCGASKSHPQITMENLQHQITTCDKSNTFVAAYYKPEVTRGDVTEAGFDLDSLDDRILRMECYN